MQADEALGTSGGRRELGDRQRRGSGGKHRLGVGMTSELGQVGEHGRLAAVMLDHRLDQEGGGGEVVEVGHHPDLFLLERVVAQLGVALDDRRARAVGGGVGPGPQEHVTPAMGGRGGQPARNRSRTGDSESFLQGCS